MALHTGTGLRHMRETQEARARSWAWQTAPRLASRSAKGLGQAAADPGRLAGLFLVVV